MGLGRTVLDVARVAGVLGLGFACAPACAPTMRTEALKLRVTTPDGEEIRDTVRAPTSWDLDSLGVAFAAWPHASEFGPDLDLGLMAQIYPFQPGAYTSATSTLVLDGETITSASGEVVVDVARVKWTGSGHFPFVYEGEIRGDIAGHAVEGSWTISNDDCADDLVAGYGCGGSFPTGDFEEVAWEVSWRETACPVEITERWIGGTTVTLSRGGADAGADALGCAVTDTVDFQLICGDDARIEAGGRTWAVTAVAWHGPHYTGQDMEFAVNAGTVDEGEPLVCTARATPVRQITTP